MFCVSSTISIIIRVSIKMAKVKKETSFLVSTAGSGFFYPNRKNRKKIRGGKKLELKKYDPKLRKHVLFVEQKLSKVKERFDREKVLKKITANHN